MLNITEFSNSLSESVNVLKSQISVIVVVVERALAEPRHALEVEARGAAGTAIISILAVLEAVGDRAGGALNKASRASLADRECSGNA
jgi:hypothetical protein